MDVERLRRDVNEALDRWDEVSLFTLANVSGLTRAEMDTLIGCCDWYDEKKSLHGLAYFSPAVKAVLRSYGAVSV